MSLKNTAESCGWASQSLHWRTAGLILRRCIPVYCSQRYRKPNISAFPRDASLFDQQPAYGQRTA